MNRSDYNLAQWLQWMEDNHPTEIDLGLARVGQVYQRMQLDLSATKVISIAGTNGKGSTTTFLETIYLAADYTTLAYTSPHMLLYNERVRLNGVDVNDELLIAAFRAIDQAMGVDEQRISLSYFEIGTLAAIYLVSQQKPDIALLEVGLGGRLDAVNIIDADVAVITTLAVDHIDWLGDDIEQIGREKAGIGRVGKPLVCGEIQPPKSIAQLASEQAFALVQINQDYSYQTAQDQNSWSFTGVDLLGNKVTYQQLPMPNLPLQNAATALQVIEQLAMPCSYEARVKGLSAAKSLGRQQQVRYLDKNILLDVAHNPQSAQLLAHSLLKRGLQGEVQFVLGVLIDKDAQGLMLALESVAAHWHFVTLDVYRGQSALQLQEKSLASNIDQHNVSCYQDMRSALEGALLKASASQVADEEQNEHLVVVAGSFVTVAQVLALQGVEQKVLQVI
ncbi:MAG: bifunctional tetrahydrofolate synthase/dihydrofolate synthase [Oceanospirillaceae bacterium]